MPPVRRKFISLPVLAAIIAILPSAALADILMNLSSPSYDFGPSLLNRSYAKRTATLFFTNTGATPQSGRVYLSTSSDAIQFEVPVFPLQVNPGETVSECIEILFTPMSVGRIFERINIITDFGVSAKQSLMASCYAGASIQGHIYDYATKEVIPASACTSPSFEIRTIAGCFSGRWFAGSYEFTASAAGYYRKVEHIFLPENATRSWNPELVPIIALGEAASELQALVGSTAQRTRIRIDLDQDGQLGLAETVLYLRTLAEVRGRKKNGLTSNVRQPFRSRHRFWP